MQLSSVIFAFYIFYDWPVDMQISALLKRSQYRDSVTQVTIKGLLFNIVSCLSGGFFLLWHWHIIFGTWVYLHETMCCIQWWSLYNVDLDLELRFIGFLKWLCVRATIFYPLINILNMNVSSLDNVSHTFLTSVWPCPLA